MRIKRIEHVAIAVEDMAVVSAVLKNVLGLNMEYAEELPEHQTKLAMFPVGETYLELLEGTSPNSETSRWISQKGAGLWHLCFEVDNIDTAVGELKAKNIRLLSDTPLIGHGGARIIFLDPSDTHGLVFELMEPLRR